MDHPTAPTSHLRLVLGPQPFRPGMAWILINESPLGACVTWVWRASLVISNKCAPFETILHILMGFVGYSTVWFRSVQSFLVYPSPFRMLRGETW